MNEEPRYMVLIPPILERTAEDPDISVAVTPWLIDALYDDLEVAKENARACSGIVVKVMEVQP